MGCRLALHPHLVAYPAVSLNKEGPLLGGQVAILKDSLNILLSKNVKTI